MKLIIILVMVFCLPFASSYIDPGTAGMVIGGTIWPIIVTVFTAIAGFFVKFFWKPIKRGVSKFFQSFKKKE